MYALLIVLIVLEALLLLRLAIKLRRRKYDGNMVVHDTDDKTTFSLEIDTEPAVLVNQKSISLKVVTAEE